MNVPKLRFKEFTDEWKKDVVGNVSNIFLGVTYTPKYVDKGMAFISSKDISKGYLDLSDIKYISEGEYNKISNNAKPQKGDVLFTRVGSNLGNPTVIETTLPLTIFVSLGYIKVNKKIINNYFIKYWMESNYFWHQVDSKVAGGAKQNLNTGWLSKFSINFPSVKEQTKISNFLSLLDEKIELQTKKIEALKLYKLSQMKDTFNKQYLKTKVFKDIAIINKGTQLKNEELLDNGKYYMLNGGINPSGYTSQYNCSANTITISEGGNSCGYVNFNKSEFWCGGHCYSIVPKEINNLYLYQNLKYNEKRIMTLRVGSGLPNIQKKDLEKFKLKIHDINDQIKVANYLLLYDEKISLEISKLKKLNELKKGFMQNMFI